eukprot:1341916-Amphidinium_carterae.1
MRRTCGQLSGSYRLLGVRVREFLLSWGDFLGQHVHMGAPDDGIVTCHCRCVCEVYFSTYQLELLQTEGCWDCAAVVVLTLRVVNFCHTWSFRSPTKLLRSCSAP